MKKKWITKAGKPLAVALMLSLAVAGCGKQKAEPETQTESQPAMDYTEDEFDQAVESGEISEEQMVYDLADVKTDDVTVSFQEPEIQEGKKFSLTASAANASSDVTYQVIFEPVYANGLNCGLYFTEELQPGESKDTEIVLEKDVLDLLEKGGCGEVRTLDLYTRITIPGDYLSEPVFEDKFTIHPYESDYYPVYEREAADTDTVFMDSDDAQVVLTETGMTSDGYIWKVFLKNKNGSDLMFSLEDVTLNGTMADPCWSRIVKGEGCSYEEVYWSKEVLEEAGVTDVSEVIFSLVLYDAENFESDWRVCENITYQP